MNDKVAIQLYLFFTYSWKQQSILDSIGTGTHIIIVL